jgi:hypothetical protein
MMLRRNVAFVVGLSALCFGCGSNAPTSPTSGAIFRQGTLVILQTFTADLDEGVVVNNPLGPSDVWFEAATATDWFFVSTGARLAVVGTSAPGFSVCHNANLSSARIAMTTLTPGLYLCGKTDQGRFVEMRVVELPVKQPSGMDATLTLSFTTYMN